MKNDKIILWEQQTIDGKAQIVDIPVTFYSKREYKLALGWRNGGGSMEKRKFFQAMEQLRMATGIRDFQMFAYSFAKGFRFAQTLEARMFCDSAKGV